jgi:hypothetical protein
VTDAALMREFNRQRRIYDRRADVAWFRCRAVSCFMAGEEQAGYYSLFEAELADDKANELAQGNACD